MHAVQPEPAVHATLMPQHAAPQPRPLHPFTPRACPTQIALPAGSAIYLPANEPHAYVSGELMEAMASSDNVIRAGLTPKFRDTEVLCESLTYTMGKPEVGSRGVCGLRGRWLVV